MKRDMATAVVAVLNTSQPKLDMPPSAAVILKTPKKLTDSDPDASSQKLKSVSLSRKRKLEEESSGRQESYTVRGSKMPRILKVSSIGCLPLPPFHRIASQVFCAEFPLDSEDDSVQESTNVAARVPDCGACFCLNFTEQNLNSNQMVLFRFCYKPEKETVEFCPPFLKLVLNEKTVLTTVDNGFRGLSVNPYYQVCSPICVPVGTFKKQNRICLTWGKISSTNRQNKFAMYVQLAYFMRPKLILSDLSTRKIDMNTTIMKLHRKLTRVDAVSLASEQLSLTCPISRRRLELPVRGIRCKHSECFEAEQFITLNQNPNCPSKWQCPKCKKFTPMHQLRTDSFVLDLLDKFPGTNNVRVNAEDGRLIVSEVPAAPADAVVDLE